MKALVAIALTLAFATPAAAATVAHRTPAVGPVFAGDSIVWGEKTGRGASLVMQAAPGRAAVLVHRVPPATAQSSFAASASGFGALVSTATVVFEESDAVSVASTTAAIAGPWHGPVPVLGGCIPASGDDVCPGSCDPVQATAVDGARTALAKPTGLCEDEGERRNGVTIRGPAGTTVAMAAGRLLHTRLISERRNRFDLVLRSLAGGLPRVLSRLTERRRLVGDFDVDAARATWAEVPARRGYDLIPRGPARIIVRDL